MFWVFMIVLLLYSSIESLVEAYKSKDPNYQKDQILKAEAKTKERLELRKLLEEQLGNPCVLSFNNFALISKYSDKCSGKITHVEDHWVALETGKDAKRKQIIFKIEDISSVSKII
ncbi:MAG TPA: hypothetical protein VIG45_06575 [Erysipelothrix sp.]